jgi:hypothetical protein
MSHSPLSHSPFATDNYDLAMTKVAEGAAVSYTGPHQGVFRFESVKLAALMTLPPEKRPPIPPEVLGDSPANTMASRPAGTSRNTVGQDETKSAE